MIRVYCAVLFAMVIAMPLQAGGADDLKAGLAALQNGKHDEANQQLTRAVWLDPSLVVECKFPNAWVTCARLFL
jgi:hypothetical protein